MATILPQTIVDVRSAEEFEGFHIPGAMNIPLSEVAVRLEEFKTMKSPILLYCKSGIRSRAATSLPGARKNSRCN